MSIGFGVQDDRVGQVRAAGPAASPRVSLSTGSASCWKHSALAQ